MRHLEKPIREIFDEICQDKLTNLEIDAFIKQTTDKFKLPKLKRLIIDFERYIQQERTDVLVYFEYIYGDREKFKKNVAVDDEESLKNIFDRYMIKFKNSPEVIHSDYDTNSQEITDFSPLVEKFSTEKTKDNYYQSLSLYTSRLNKFNGIAFSLGGNLFGSVAHVLASTYALRSMNSSKFKKTVGKLSGEDAKDDLDSVGEFTKGLKVFLKSPLYHFHVKLHTLYNLIKESFSKQNEIVTETTEKYDTNVSPDNANIASKMSHADKVKKYNDNYWESAFELYYDGYKWKDVYKKGQDNLREFKIL